MFKVLYNIDQLNYWLVIRKPTELIPIQIDFEYNKLTEIFGISQQLNYAFNAFPTVIKYLPIFITSDNRIIDGHHKWMISQILNPEANLLCIRVNRRFSRELIEILYEYTSSHSNSGIHNKTVTEDIRNIDKLVFRKDSIEKSDMTSRANLLSCSGSFSKGLLSDGMFGRYMEDRYSEFKEDLYSGKYELTFIRRQLPQLSLCDDLLSRMKYKLSPVD